MLRVLPLKETVRYPSENIFKTRNVRTVSYGLNTLAHLGPKIWELVPQNIKDEISLKMFTQKIRKWRPDKCPCKLCKLYIKDLGYL